MGGRGVHLPAQGSKQFFFEKKNQKTFMSPEAGRTARLS
jgi:hypothetical protein